MIHCLIVNIIISCIKFYSMMCVTVCVQFFPEIIIVIHNGL